MVDHPSDQARDAAQKAGEESEANPKFTTASAGPDDRLKPFEATPEDNATGRSAAIDRFGLPVIPAERGPAPAPAGAPAPAAPAPAGAVAAPAAGVAAPAPGTRAAGAAGAAAPAAGARAGEGGTESNAPEAPRASVGGTTEVQR